MAYTELAVFVPSLLYGAFVVARCEAVAPAVEKNLESAYAPNHSKFPDSVLEFKLAADAPGIQSACLGSGGSWQVDGDVSSCRSPNASPERPNARFQFRRGQVSQLTIVYPVAAEQLRAKLDAVLKQLESSYGRPQRGPAPWRAGCDEQSIAQCLQGGDKPGRSLWNWPSGYIELLPVNVAGELAVETRYFRYETE